MRHSTGRGVAGDNGPQSSGPRPLVGSVTGGRIVVMLSGLPFCQSSRRAAVDEAKDSSIGQDFPIFPDGAVL